MNGDIAALLMLMAVPAVIFLVIAGRRHRIRRRRQRLRALPAAEKLTSTLQEYVSIYPRLPGPLRDELHGHIQVFLDEKTFIGCDNLEVTDEMRFTIAGLACLLLLNRQATYFPGFTSILVYPGSYKATEVSYDGPQETRRQSVRAGESWHRGPVVLSWDDVLRGAADAGDGYNVVLHEFAHKLDEENNGTNGMPILGTAASRGEWASVLGKEFERFAERVAGGRNRVIDEYGLTSPPEFFAVATESFFEKPAAMKKDLPDLYAQLQRFYRLDPATWAKR